MKNSVGDFSGPSSSHKPFEGTSADTPPVPPIEPPTILSPKKPSSVSEPILEDRSDRPTVISKPIRKSHFDSEITQSLIGRRLGPFVLQSPIGVGGMAAVMRARDDSLGRDAAVKILPPDLATDPENVSRFRLEARAVARLDHDNIARVYAAGEDNGLHYIAFEFVEGENLRQRMYAQGGKITPQEAISYLMQVASGLAHAASRGVVHRDVKPSNIIITPSGTAKLVDMGLARNLESSSFNGQLTQSGMTLGTFDYIAPEQAIDPRTADVRSDIYSLGCTFYHVLTGRPPVPEGTAAKKLDAHQRHRPIDPRLLNPEIPNELVAILGRMMAKKPEQRYQDPESLIADLQPLAVRYGIYQPKNIEAAHESSISRPRTWWWLLAASIFLITLVVVFFLSRPPYEESQRIENRGWPTPVVIQNPTPLDSPNPPLKNPPNLLGLQQANTSAELISLLKQGANDIFLTGNEYDLSKESGLELRSHSIRIRGAEGRNCKIILPDGSPSGSGISFKGMDENRPLSLTLTNLRLEWKTLNNGTGLHIDQFQSIEVTRCAFVSPTNATGNALSLSTKAWPDMLPNVQFSECYFATAGQAIQIDSPIQLFLTDCCLGIYRGSFLHVLPYLRTDRLASVRFLRCSAILNGAALLELADQTPLLITAGHCLFTGSMGATRGILVKQIGSPHRSTVYEVLKRLQGSETITSPNAYRDLWAYSEADNLYSFADLGMDSPIKETEKVIPHPWKEANPYPLVGENLEKAKTAFLVNETIPALRDGSGKNLLGSAYFLGESLRPDQLTPIRPSLPLGTRVLDPSLPEKLEPPAGTYRTLSRALEGIKSGNVTILIKHNGELVLDPIELKSADVNITLKPYEKSKPILVPAPAQLKREPGLFQVYGGKLRLEGLQFRLPPDRVAALVACPGGGQLELVQVAATLESGDDLALISLTDPKGEMMFNSEKKNPKLMLDRVFLRGRGKLLNVKASRPFELDAKNLLAVLDSSLIEMAPNLEKDVTGSSTIKLQKTTTCLSGPLLNVKAGTGRPEGGPQGFVKTEFSVESSIFTPALSEGPEAIPLIRADKFENWEALKTFLSWSSKDVIYGYDKKKMLVDIRPNDTDAMPMATIDGDKWIAFTKELGEPFAIVRFRYELPKAGQVARFVSTPPSDFQLISTTPPLLEGTSKPGVIDYPTLMEESMPR